MWISIMNFIDEISVIEINPTELCNLKCSFCPRATFYPNQNLHMSIETAEVISQQLREINYTGELSITGRGEPTLHPEFDKLCEIFFKDKTWTTKINTNGKRYDKWMRTVNNFDKVIWNCYEHTKEQYHKEIERFNHLDYFVINYKPVEMSWQDRPSFTNRAGSFPTNHLPDIQYCDTPFVKMFIDYDGTYRLCCEDWKAKIVMGSVYEQTIAEYIAENEKLKEYRKRLAEGDRSLTPCMSCSYNITSYKNGCSENKWKALQAMTRMENLDLGA